MQKARPGSPGRAFSLRTLSLMRDSPQGVAVVPDRGRRLSD